jgi:hypothetical protein
MDLVVARPIQIETLTLELISPRELVCLGSIDRPAAQYEFEQQLRALDVHIVTLKLPSFTVDVRGLSFVNSSAISMFVKWISRAKAANYRLVFLTDRSITWHRLSFSVLKSLAPQAVEVVERTGSGPPAA